MKPGRLLLFATAFSAFFSACSGTGDTDDGSQVLTSESLAEHIRVLASDEYEGRMPFTEGETKTLRYLQNTFRELGLEPGNGNGYLQEVPLLEISSVPDQVMYIKGKRGKATFAGFDDYVIWSQQTGETADLTGEEIIFAGFGIVAPEYGWDDYKDLDVKGKLVIVLVNDPGFGSDDTTLFKGNTMTYYGRWPYKFEEAARHGAKGCIVIHNTAAAGYDFANPQNNWKAPRLFLDKKGKGQYMCDVVGWMSEPATARLFRLAGYGFEELKSAAGKKGFTGISLGLGAFTSMKVRAKHDISYNILGKITGTKRPAEYIIYSAHWDHVGIGRPDETGDTIYNGAVDNASGVAGILEIAKAFKALKRPPERTIVFLALTAEEQGLLGSEYYAFNPVFPLDSTVANINLDAILSMGRMKDISVVGNGQSELEDYLKQEAEKVGRYVSPDPNPAAGYYFRSDHYHFAKAGVPALSTSNGVDEWTKGRELGRRLDKEYSDKHYHKPSDEYNPDWDLEGTVNDLKLLFRVGKRIAFEEHWPQWKEHSEFKALRTTGKQATH